MSTFVDFLLRNKSKLGGTATAIIMVLPWPEPYHWIKEVCLILAAAIGGAGLGDKDAVAAAKQLREQSGKEERRSL